MTKIHLTDEANSNRDAIDSIRHRMNSGVITYEQAQEEAKPIIDRMNEKAKRIAIQYDAKFKPFSFKSLMR